MNTVLVTRLMPFAGSLIENLEQNGYNVIHESLLSAEPLYCRRPEIPSSGKPIVALTSRVTLEILQQRRDEVENLLESPCYCVGDKTANDARNFGFTNVISAQGNGQDLAQTIMDTELFKSPVIHLGGEDISDDPDSLLSQQGWQVIHWPLYKAIEIQDLSELVINDIKSGEINAILLYSVRAAQIFAKLIHRYELEACCVELTIYGLSRSILNELDELKFKNTYAPRRPTENDLIESVLTNSPIDGASDDQRQQEKNYC